MHFDAVQLDRFAEWHVHVFGAVDTRRVHMDIVSASREGSGKAVNGTNGSTVADGRVVRGYNLQYSQCAGHGFSPRLLS
jgi:hypothetical protein